MTADTEGVVTGAAGEAVVATAAINQIVPVVTGDTVVTPTAIDQIVAGTGGHIVVAAAGIDLLAALVPVDAVRTLVAQDNRCLPVKEIEPGGDIKKRGIRVTILIEEVAIADLETQVIDAVAHRVHQVATKEIGRGTVVLNVVITAGIPALVIAMQIRPLFQQSGIALDQMIHRGEFFDRDPAVGTRAGFADQVDDDPVHGIGGFGAFVDLGRRRIACQPAVALDHIDNAIQPGAGARGVGEEVVEPVGDIRQGGIAITILIEEMTVLDHETEVVDAVGHGIDEVLAEEGGAGAIVLDLVETGLQTPLVIPVQPSPFGQAPGIGTQVAVQGDHVRHRNPVVTGHTDRRQSFAQHQVQAIGGIGTSGDLLVADPAIEPGIGHDQVGHSVQPGAALRVVNIELGQPFGDLFQRSVRIAILVEQVTVADFEAQVVDAIDDRVEQIVAAVPAVAAVVLDQVVASLRVRFVVAVQHRPLAGIVAAQIGVHGPDFVDGKHLVIGSVCCRGRFYDQFVQLIGRPGSRLDVLSVGCAREPGIAMDRVDDLIETRPGQSGRRTPDKTVRPDSRTAGHGWTPSKGRRDGQMRGGRSGDFADRNESIADIIIVSKVARRRRQR